MLNLRWNSFTSELTTTLDTCYEKQYFVDLSLVSKDGTIIKCHKMVLANSSKFFYRLLINNDHPHPMIVLYDIETDDLKTIVNFMYNGEIEIVKSEVNRLLKIAERLEISGLKDIRSSQKYQNTLINDSQSGPGINEEKKLKLQKDNKKNGQKKINNIRKSSLESVDDNFADENPIVNKQKVEKNTDMYKMKKRKSVNDDELSLLQNLTAESDCKYLKKLRSLNEIEIICKPNEILEDEILNIEQSTPNPYDKVYSPCSNSNSNSSVFLKDELNDVPYDDYKTRFPIARRAVRKKLFTTPGIEIFKSAPSSDNLMSQSMPSTSSTSPRLDTL